MIKKFAFCFFFVLCLLPCNSLCTGQPAERLIQVLVTPDHTNWLYQPGEKVKFKVAVLKCNIPQDHLEVRYEISEDMMKPHQTGKQPFEE